MKNWSERMMVFDGSVCQGLVQPKEFIQSN